MIRHIVMWNFVDSLTPEEKRFKAIQIKSSLEDMLYAVEGVEYMRVVIDGMDAGNADLLLESAFEDEDALRKYYEHPAHIRILEYLGECTTDKMRMDFKA